MNSTPQDGTSQGGLAVVFVFFFVIGFLIALLMQFLFVSFWQSSQSRPSDFSEFLAETKKETIIKPEPRFSPEQVVSYQLERLRSEELTTGIHQCFAFASPANKQITGPISRFARMLQNSPYSVLISPQELLIGKPELHDDHATVTVTLLDSHGELHAFQFFLTRQTEGEYSGCWMTESVFRLQPSDTREPERSPTVSYPGVPELSITRIWFS